MKDFLIKNLSNDREIYLTEKEALFFLPLSIRIMLTAEKKDGLYEIEKRT